MIPVALQLVELGLKIYATPGTAHILRDGGVECEIAYRIAEGKSPDALGLMRRGEIQFIVNVPTISGGAVRDGNMMRRLAVEMNIPFVTTMNGARMEVAAIRAAGQGPTTPKRLLVDYLDGRGI